MAYITINDLPDEVLQIIFNLLNVHGHLRLSSVCKRFFTLISNDVLFMRTLKFKYDIDARLALRELGAPATSLRTYEQVELSGYDLHDHWSLNMLLEKVETLELSFCRFNDTNELLTMLKWCPQLNSIIISNPQFLNSNIIETKDKLKKPVSLSIDTPNCPSLECFAEIEKLTIYIWDDMNGTQYGANVVRQHAAAISSMSVFEDSAEFLQLLVMTPELKLKHLEIDLNYCSEHAGLLQQFFASQKSALSSLIVTGRMVQTTFNAIIHNLSSLETLWWNVWNPSDAMELNKLKCLPGLRKLRIIQEYTTDADENEMESCLYSIDFSELRNLEELRVEINFSSDLILTLNKPMVLLKKLDLRYPINVDLMEQIVTKLPNLTSLLVGIEFDDAGFGLDVVQKVNQLVKLECLEIFGEKVTQLISGGCLAGLQLPRLKRLHVYKEQLLKVNRSVLSALAQNSPKLLRITKSNRRPYFRNENRKDIIAYKRLNRTSEFRRVRRPAELDKLKTMDYDSVESCSDED